MLSPANVSGFYATANSIADLTPRLNTMRLEPLISAEAIRTPGTTALHRWVTNIDFRVTSRRIFLDAITRALNPDDTDGAFVWLYDDPAPNGISGAWVPCAISGKPIQNVNMPSAALSDTVAVFEPRGVRPQYIANGIKVTSDATHNLGQAQNVIALVTTAGTISGNAVSVGWHILTTQATYTTAGGLRGYLLNAYEPYSFKNA